MIAGVLFAALIFFAGPFIFLVLLLKFIFTPFGMGRMMMMNRFGSMGMQFPYFAYADKIRTMSEEDYQTFKQRNTNRCHSSFEREY